MNAPDRIFEDEIAPRIHELTPYALSLTGNAVDADELKQATLIRAWELRANYQPGTNAAGWMNRIMRFQHMDTIGKARYRPRITTGLIDGYELAPNKDWLPSAEDVYLKTDEDASLRRKISRLPDHYARAIDLFYWHQRTCKEIADEMGLKSQKVAASYLHDGRASLKRMGVTR